MALALGNGLEPKINETTKDSSNVIVRISSDVVKQVTFYFIKSFDFILGLGVSICLDVVSIETLDLDISKS
jgi:hypothetical protein